MPIAKSVGKAAFGDVLGSLIYAPAFWYGRGLRDAGRFCLRLMRRRWAELGVGVWIRNLFVPMYGQRDAAGMIISFFMRLVQIFARSAAFLFWVALSLALFAAYVIVPGVVFWQLLGQIFALF